MSCSKYEIPKQMSVLKIDTTKLVMHTSQNSILPSNQVNVVHTHQGNVWMGTVDGLALKKSSSWSLFNTLNSRLPNNYITAIESDNFNNLWVGTLAGLAVYDGRIWKDLDSVNQKYFSNAIVNDIIYDRFNDLIWIATSNGILRFDKKVWKLFNSTNSGLMDDYVITLTMDKSNQLVLGTFDQFQFRGKLWKYDMQNWTSTKLDDKGLNSSFPGHLLQSQNGNLYFTTKGTTGSAFVEINGSIWNVYSKNQNENFKTEVTSVADWKDYILIGKSDGLMRYDGKEFLNIDLNYPGNYNMYVSDLEVSDDGTIYMATYNNGLCEILLAE